MFKKIIIPAIILASLSANAAGKPKHHAKKTAHPAPVAAKKDGLHVRYNIESNSGTQPVHSTVDYYYQSGDFLAVVRLLEGGMDQIVFMEKDGRKYSLFPKEKTYVEVKDYEATLSTFQPETEGTFETLKTKKKILGYKCELHRKESKSGITNVCVSPLLYKNWSQFLSVIENKSDSIAQIKGFPIEIVTLTNEQRNQTTVVMSAIHQGDYRKKFEILNDYKKKETPDVQASSAKMLNSMKTTTPKSQKELDEMEKLTKEANKKYPATKPENDPVIPEQEPQPE